MVLDTGSSKTKKILKLRIVIRLSILYNNIIFKELNNFLVFTYPSIKFDNFLMELF